MYPGYRKTGKKRDGGRGRERERERKANTGLNQDDTHDLSNNQIQLLLTHSCSKRRPGTKWFSETRQGTRPPPQPSFPSMLSTNSFSLWRLGKSSRTCAEHFAQFPQFEPRSAKTPHTHTQTVAGRVGDKVCIFACVYIEHYSICRIRGFTLMMPFWTGPRSSNNQILNRFGKWRQNTNDFRAPFLIFYVHPSQVPLYVVLLSSWCFEVPCPILLPFYSFLRWIRYRVVCCNYLFFQTHFQILFRVCHGP